jgi:hypothetical protein
MHIVLAKLDQLKIDSPKCVDFYAELCAEVTAAAAQANARLTLAELKSLFVPKNETLTQDDSFKLALATARHMKSKEPGALGLKCLEQTYVLELLTDLGRTSRKQLEAMLRE